MTTPSPSAPNRALDEYATSGSTTLDLRGSDLGDEGAASLAAALTLRLNLTELNLCCNGIGAAGAASLASALPSCPNLAVVTVSHNTFGTEGAASLASALPFCPNLTHLYSGFNVIGDEGAASLASALPSCSRLETLYLSNSGIGPKGVESLLSALPLCPSLIDVVLGGPAEEGAYAAIERRLRSHRSRRRAARLTLTLCCAGDVVPSHSMLKRLSGLILNSDGDDAIKRTVRDMTLELATLP